jgi:hypothetical protein
MKKAKRDANKATQEDAQLAQLQKPDSQETLQARALAKTLVGGLRSNGLFKNNPGALDSLEKSFDSSNGYQIQEMIDKSPILKQMTTLAGSTAKSDGMNAYFMAKLAQGEAGQDIRRDDQASHAVDKIHNDHPIQQLSQQVQLVDRGLDILKRPKLTNAEFNDVQIELSNAISGARSAAMGKLERTEYDTMAQHLAELKQKITGQPQDAVPPEILARVQSLAQETAESFRKHRAERAMALRRNFANNPDATAQMEDAIKQYAGDYYDRGAPREPMRAGGGLPGMASAQAGTQAPAPQTQPQQGKTFRNKRDGKLYQQQPDGSMVEVR